LAIPDTAPSAKALTYALRALSGKAEVVHVMLPIVARTRTEPIAMVAASAGDVGGGTAAPPTLTCASRSRDIQPIFDGRQNFLTLLGRCSTMANTAV
jgi:hypothetical protein